MRGWAQPGNRSARAGSGRAGWEPRGREVTAPQGGGRRPRVRLGGRGPAGPDAPSPSAHLHGGGGGHPGGGGEACRSLGDKAPAGGGGREEGALLAPPPVPSSAPRPRQGPAHKQPAAARKAASPPGRRGRGAAAIPSERPAPTATGGSADTNLCGRGRRLRGRTHDAGPGAAAAPAAAPPPPGVALPDRRRLDLSFSSSRRRSGEGSVQDPPRTLWGVGGGCARACEGANVRAWERAMGGGRRREQAGPAAGGGAPWGTCARALTPTEPSRACGGRPRRWLPRASPTLPARRPASCGRVQGRAGRLLCVARGGSSRNYLPRPPPPQEKRGAGVPYPPTSGNTPVPRGERPGCGGRCRGEC
ncbi:uncharacterized protein [Notamacropus eugenii]|uniref:uncharacterized protein n=1 Tax=Notamacropus eugenii TaxID=9315 RepID=UPI003B684DE7